MFKFLLLALTVTAASVNTVTSTYSKTGECEEKTCIYRYSISGEIHDKRATEELKVSTKVTLRCESEGMFNGEDAKYYCIRFDNSLQKFYEKKIDEETKMQRKRLKDSIDVTSIMQNRFCFVRNSNGRLLAVFYPTNETSEIVNIKKTIASSFQANFDKTTEEIEIDPQSVHKAHYSYKSKGKSTVEHRSVSNQDVVTYSGNAKKKNVDYHSEEDVEVDEDNVIRQSSGTSTTSLSKTDKSEEKPQKNDQDIPPIEIKSHYSMKLVKCLPMSWSDEDDYYNDEYYATKWDHKPVMDGLLAKIDERARDLEEMEDVNNQLDDLTETVKRMVRDTSSNELQDGRAHTESILKWRKILHLEAKHGAPGGRKSKLEVIFDTLKKVSSDDFNHNVHVRLAIYNLLSSEGSLAAQQALLNALKLNVKTREEEYDNIVMAITLLQSINHSTLLDFKEYVMDNMMMDNNLLLSFATLGRYKNVEHEVVDTITQLIEQQGVNDTETLMYFIHALGNTGSKLIIPHLIPFLVNDNDKDIQLTVIDALRTVSADKNVQETFSNLITSDVESIDMMLAIIESLQFPYESFLYYPEAPEEPEDAAVEKKLLTNIVNATIHFHDGALYNATAKYLKTITNDFPTQLLKELSIRYGTEHRNRRSYTTDWEDSNSIYDSVDSYYSRSSDVSEYPYNKAILWAKTLGPSKVHGILGVGGFAGVGGSGYKVYGKGVFKVYCFGNTYTAVDGEYNARYNIFSGHPTVRRYVKVLGTAHSTATTASSSLLYSNWSKTFFSLPFFYFETFMFIAVGLLSFTVTGTANLDASLTLKMQTLGANAELMVRPSITITGGAELDLLFYKIGLDVSGNMGYYVSPKASAALCDTASRADASSCFGVFHGSKGLKIDISAYYHRRCLYGCMWTPKSIVSALSSSWSFSPIPEEMFWGKCNACTCTGLLHSYCQGDSLTGSGARSDCSCHIFELNDLLKEDLLKAIGPDSDVDVENGSADDRKEEQEKN